VQHAPVLLTLCDVRLGIGGTAQADSVARHEGIAATLFLRRQLRRATDDHNLYSQQFVSRSTYHSAAADYNAYHNHNNHYNDHSSQYYDDNYNAHTDDDYNDHYDYHNDSYDN